jgi:pyruvate dehydrogenase E1 component alpha subunit
MKADIISNDRVLVVYKQMLLARRFEERCAKAYGMGLIAGFCHLYIGQEAVATGIFEAKSPKDSIVTSYRCHVQAILSGGSQSDINAVMAELFGRATGSSKGKGGSMHLFDTKNKFYGGHGIVGAQASIGTGIAFADKYNQTGGACFTFMGDGALHQGQVYESFNMAKLWNLPVVYVIENNEYAMGTSVARAASIPDLYKRGESFGIPGRQVDGMDVFAVKKATDETLSYVRAGNGPILIEMKTYRYRGHSMSDPAKYRTKEELADYRDNKDPIINLQKYILEHKLATTDDFDEAENAVKISVDEAYNFALNSPQPSEGELMTEVYC